MLALDRIDSRRDLAPLQSSDYAVIIDSTHMSFEEVLERALELVQG